VDSKHNLPIDYKVTNTNDSKAMGGMLRRAKSIIGHNRFTALYDKGYHTGSEFDIADQLGIKVMVAIPAMPKSSQAPDPQYNLENFIYNQQDHTYTCPQGHTLTTNGTWHKSTNSTVFQQFKTPKCKGCPVRLKCTTSKQNGKIIQRRKYAQNIEDNRKRIENDKATYKKRQAIVEHPYGTIKRQWDFSYIITKKFKPRASADVGLMFTAYNLRRIINILGIDLFKAYLEKLALLFFHIFDTIQLKKIAFKSIKYFIEKLEIEIFNACKDFKLAQKFAVF
jgi:hypothetical protein